MFFHVFIIIASDSLIRTANGLVRAAIFLCFSLGDLTAKLPFTARRRLGPGSFIRDSEAVAGIPIPISSRSALGWDVGDSNGLVLSPRPFEDALQTLEDELAASAEPKGRLSTVRRPWFKAHPRNRRGNHKRLAELQATGEMTFLEIRPIFVEPVLSV